MKIISRLTEAEFELMNAIWKTTEPMSTNDIMKNIDNHKNWKVTTVLTLLGKLIDKKYIRAVKKGRAYEYFVLIQQQQYQKNEGKLFLNKIYNNSLKNFIAALYEENTLSNSDIQELKDWFNQKSNNTKGG